MIWFEEQRRERVLRTDPMPTHKQLREEARKHKDGGDGTLLASVLVRYAFACLVSS